MHCCHIYLLCTCTHSLYSWLTINLPYLPLLVRSSFQWILCSPADRDDSSIENIQNWRSLRFDDLRHRPSCIALPCITSKLSLRLCSCHLPSLRATPCVYHATKGNKLHPFHLESRGVKKAVSKVGGGSCAPYMHEVLNYCTQPLSVKRS